jgi:hypothetical protein
MLTWFAWHVFAAKDARTGLSNGHGYHVFSIAWIDENNFGKAIAGFYNSRGTMLRVSSFSFD